LFSKKHLSCANKDVYKFNFYILGLNLILQQAEQKIAGADIFSSETADTMIKSMRQADRLAAGKNTRERRSEV